MALKNAADARINTSSSILAPSIPKVIREERIMRISAHEIVYWLLSRAISMRFRTMFRKVLVACHRFERSNRAYFHRRRRILRQLVLALVRALHLQFIEQQRRSNHRGRQPACPVAHQRIVSRCAQIAAQRAHIQFAEHRPAHQFFMPVFGIHAIQQTRRIPRPHRLDAIRRMAAPGP